LDLRAEQHEAGPAYHDLYEAAAELKRRYDLHPSAVRPRDGLSLRRDAEREAVLELVKRFRELPGEQQRRMPALLNSLAQLEVVVGDLEEAQRDFAEVAGLVEDGADRAGASHNVYRTALERRDWDEALAALRRAVELDAAGYAPFPPDRFEPARILGAGGFGTIFLCDDRDGGRRVVVLALRPDSLDRDVDALFREAALLQELDHPVPTRVRESGRAGADGDRPFFVVDHFDGQTLGAHVARHGPLPPAEWLEIAWPLARALQAAHGSGVLHRSLRPGSVLLRREPDAEGAPRWRVKLLDTGFGLKRALIHATASNPAARARTALGRCVARLVPFAAPEVVGKPKGQVWVGPHSDVYSFGRLCAFALTGRPDPADGSAPLPEGWRQLVDACTAWITSRRPADFGAVLERLAGLAGDAEAPARMDREMHALTVAEHTATLEADPADAAALVARGNAYARQGEHARAAEDFSRALELRPDDAGLLRLRATAHLHAGALDQAAADFSEALRIEPHHLEAHANRGLAHARREAFDEAVADFTEAIRLNPRDPALYFNRGNAHFARGDYDLAVADYSEAVRRDPNHAWAFGNRGRAHARRGEHARAAADFTRLLQLDPKNARALADRAAAHLALGQPDRAAADYTEALGLEPTLAGAWFGRAAAHAALGRQEQAVADYTEALRLRPDDLAALHARSGVYALQGDYERALADNREAERRAPDNARTLNNLAWLWATAPKEEWRDVAKALEYARRACERTGWEDAGTLDTLAVACAAAGHFEEAVRWQRKAVELAPEADREDYRARLELYESGQPYRPTAAGGPETDAGV
jgi:tetratricopeptide (TPR) repeat protein